MTTKFLDRIIMLRFGQTKVAEKEFCVAKKQQKFRMLMLII